MSPDDYDKDELIAISATVLREVLDYIAGPIGAHADVRSSFRRCMAVLWVLRPELAGDLTQSELADRLGITRSAMSKMTTEFSDRFGFRSDRQRLPSAREHCRLAQLARREAPIPPPPKESFADSALPQVPQSCEGNE